MSRDVLIVGAGVIGASVACHLARQRIGVHLIEQSAPASAATGRSVASIDVLPSHLDLAHLHFASHRAFADFEARFGGRCGFTKTGLAVFAGADGGASGGEEALRRGGFAVERLGFDRLRALEPTWCTAEDETALYIPDAGYADPKETTETLLAAARDAGAKIELGVRATALSREGDRVTGVSTAHGSIASRIGAGLVVCAAGASSEALIGASRGLTHYRHFVAALMPAVRPRPRLSVMDLKHSFYVRPDGDEETLVGSTDRHLGYTVAEPEDLDPPDAGEVDRLVARTAQRFPNASFRAVRSWTGIITASRHWRPMVGPDPGLAGLYLALGLSSGFQMSLAIGELAAAAIGGAEDAAQRLLPLDPSR